MINAQSEVIYSVRIEIQPLLDVQTESLLEPDRDYLEELDQTIEQVDEAAEGSEDDQPLVQHRRYDLCCECLEHFVRNPLSADVPAALGFSDN